MEKVIGESPLEETVPLMEFYKKKKKKNCASEMRDEYKIMSPILLNKEEKIPLAESLKRKRPISEDEEEIPGYKRMKMFKEQKKKKKKIRRRQVSFRSEKKNSEEKNTSEKKKNALEEEKKPIPVYEGLSSSRFNIDSGTESEEEVLLDGERDELDGGFKYRLNEDAITYTRVKTPVKFYYRRGRNSGSVLHCKSYAVPTVTKLALRRYNTIEATDYKYVGLVKAYRLSVNGSHFTVRFKARLPAKPPIYFQAMIWQRIPNRQIEEALVDVHFVYPLPS